MIFSNRCFSGQVDDSNNTYTHYKAKKPDGVCFEASIDKYLIKKKHTISNLLLHFKLRPLWCENCSVETAQNINNLKNIDYILPGQILTIPRKCSGFSWQDNYDYSKLPVGSFDETQIVLKNKIKTAPAPQSKITTTAKLKTKKTQLAYNKLGAEPFGIYSELKGKSTAVKAKLITNFGKGLKVYYQKNLDILKEVVSSLSFYQTEITTDLNQATINNRSQTPLTLEAGIKYHLSTDWYLTAIVGLEENLIFLNSAPTEISVKKILNSNVSISPEYIFYRNSEWNLSVDAGLGMLLPISATSGDAKFGTHFDTELKATYKLGFGRVYAGINYLSRMQNNDTFDFTENSVVYLTGAYYLF